VYTCAHYIAQFRETLALRNNISFSIPRHCARVRCAQFPRLSSCVSIEVIIGYDDDGHYALMRDYERNGSPRYRIRLISISNESYVSISQKPTETDSSVRVRTARSVFGGKCAPFQRNNKRIDSLINQLLGSRFIFSYQPRDHRARVVTFPRVQSPLNPALS